jgi:multicomponent Na+:H+ antiporter subunit C
VTGATAYSLASAALVALGLHALVVRPDLLRKIVGANVAGAGIFLLLVTIAYRGGGEAPDPVPHALVLTGIVVAVSLTAFAVALARRLHDETGAERLPEDEQR